MNRKKSLALILIAAALAYLLYFFYMRYLLKFDMMRSDVLGYWKESLEWKTPFSAWWVPGYQLLIAALRGLTLNLLPPLAVMMIISGLSYMVGIIAVFDFASHINFRYPVHITLLFAFFPFTGLSSTVNPIADSLAFALLFLCLLSYQKQQWRLFTLFAALCLITQKVLWIFVPPVMLLAFILHKSARPLVPLALIPLLAWIIGGAFHHKDPLWFMRWSVENLIVSKSALPVLDGIVSSLRSGSVARMAKGAVVLAIFALSLMLFIYSWRYKEWLGMSVSFSLLLMCSIINSYEIWAAVRYGKAVVIPLAIVLQRADWKSNLPSNKILAIAAVILLICSNLAVGYYSGKYFFA